jgi:indolepyruvate ferredoxin oxidoreductase
VPEGSLALAGIGCHVMATAIYPEHNRTTTHMGGEGVPWLGQAWFSKRAHVFANLGDGTYYHSGSLAIRAAVAAGVNITYKILYNDAVAMTGGQPVDGPITVPRIVRQLAAEGVGRIALVAEDPTRWRDPAQWPGPADGLRFTLHPRADLDTVQRMLREVPGVSVLIYDQVCAAEKRRRRKKGEIPEAPQRAYINPAVCEGCGDCGLQSNCTSLLPLVTPQGTKRRIDQSSCNVDLSCLKGFCPSFVSIVGATPRKPRRVEAAGWPLPDAPQPRVGDCNILVTGIGGSGVITIGALIGMAAHLEGKSASVLDMTGMSQKNGAVTSHVRIVARSASQRAQRIPTGEADLLLGCDMLTSAAAETLAKVRAGRTHAIVNTFEQPTGRFAQERDWSFPAAKARALIGEAVGGNADFLDATVLATALVGDAIATNLFMLGVASQKGKLPVSDDALRRAIELNGVAVQANLSAFDWGRRTAHDLAAVQRAALPTKRIELPQRPQTLDALVAANAAHLEAYQNAGYARRYTELVERVRAAESRRGSSALTKAVAMQLMRLMAYKDEYEVARLYVDPAFRQGLAAEFDGRPRLHFHFAPPLFSRPGPDGRPRKRRFGPLLEPALRLLAALRFLRGTAFDPFGRSEERRMERSLVEDYFADVETMLSRFDELDMEVAAAYARVPELIRGFGPVKQAAMAAARARREALRPRLYGVAGDEAATLTPAAAAVMSATAQ